MFRQIRHQTVTWLWRGCRPNTVRMGLCAIHRAYSRGCRPRESRGAGVSKKRKAPKAVVEEFEVDGIPVRLTRKRVRRLNLRIARDGTYVEMSAPSRISLAQIEGFVTDKESWIRSRMAEAVSSPAGQAEHATPQEASEWNAAVAAAVPALVGEWEPIVGVKAGPIVYRNMKSKWGSCQPATGRICINTRLALYPPECLEYVVVHELCHLKEANHGPAFHQLLDTYMPDWKRRRAELR